jgi:hypothetical protein
MWPRTQEERDRQRNCGTHSQKYHLHWLYVVNVL